MNSILIFVILYGLLPIGFYWKIKPTNISAIVPFLVVVFVASLYEFIGSIVFRLDYKNWYLIYKVLAFSGLLYFFNNIAYIKKSLIWIAFLGFIALFILTYTVWQEIHYFEINAYFNLYQTIIVALFSTFWFKETFEKLETDLLWNNPNYFFIAGLIIYYFGTALLFVMANYLFNKDPKSFQEYWFLNIILNFVLRTCLILGIWKARTK